MAYRLTIIVLLSCVGCGSRGRPESRPQPTPKEDTCIESQAGQYRCAGSAVQQCDFGQWKILQNCYLTGQVCEEPGIGVAQCVGEVTNTCGGQFEGASRCQGNTLETCSSGSWTMSAECTSGGLVCVDPGNGAATCVDNSTTCPSDGYLRCDVGRNIVQTCSSNNWIDVQPCGDQNCIQDEPGIAGCKDDVVNPTECNLGATRCVGEYSVEYCDGSDWIAFQDCFGVGQTCGPVGDGYGCVDNGPDNSCGPSESGDTRCEGSAVMLCNGSSWNTSQVCFSPSVCEAVGVGVATCSQVCNDTPFVPTDSAAYYDSAWLSEWLVDLSNSVAAARLIMSSEVTVGTHTLGVSNDDILLIAADNFGQYIATEGTLIISQLGTTPGSLVSATATDLVLSEANLETSEIYPGGRTWCLDSLSGNVTVQRYPCTLISGSTAGPGDQLCVTLNDPGGTTEYAMLCNAADINNPEDYLSLLNTCAGTCTLTPGAPDTAVCN